MKKLNLLFLFFIIIINQGLTGQTIHSSSPGSALTNGVASPWQGPYINANLAVALDSIDGFGAYVELCSGSVGDLLFFGDFDFDTFDPENSLIYLNITKRKFGAPIEDDYLVVSYNGQVISNNLADNLTTWPDNDSTFTYLLDDSSLLMDLDSEILSDENFGFLFRVDGPDDVDCATAFINAARLFVIENDMEVAVIADAGPDQNFNCNIDTITLGGPNTSIGNEFEYVWTNGSGLEVASTPFWETTDAGPFYLTVTNMSTNDMAIDTVIVGTTFEFIGLGVTSDGELSCDNPSVNLEVFTELFYFEETSTLWQTTDGNILSDPTQNVIKVNAAGTYSVVVTNLSSGCTGMETIIIDSETLGPQVSIDIPSELNCVQSTVFLDATTSSSSGAEITYVWIDGFGNEISDEEDIFVSEPGDYTLTVTEVTSGCQNVATVLVISDYNIPTIAIAEPAVLSCSNNSVLLDGDVSGDSGQFEFSWMDNNGNSIANTENVTVFEPGVYTWEVINIQNGCSISESVFVITDDNLITIFVDTTLYIDCDGSVTIYPALFTEDDTSCVFTWQPQTGLTVDPENPLLITIELSGTYTLVKTDTLTSCEQHFRFEFIVGEEVIADAGPDLILEPCDTFIESPFLSGANTSTGPNYAYSWSTPDGNIFGDTDQLMVFPTTSGTYILEVTDLTTGCTATDEAIVTMTPGLMMDISVTDATCFGAEDGGVQIIVSGGTAPYTYEGSFLALPPSGLAAGIYEVTVTDAEGCFMSQTFTINEPEELTLSLEITAAGSITAMVAGGVPAYTYDWNVGVDSATIVDPVNGTNYSVTVTDANDCTTELNLLFETNAVNHKAVKQLRCFPNPTKDVVNITLENIASNLAHLEIIDIQGKHMAHSVTFSNQNIMQISLSDFTAGTYFIHAIIDDQLYYQKLVVLK